MNASVLKPLAERIEVGIRERTERRVDDALAQARDVAFRAYSMALRATCGIPFDVVIADVMAEAEKSLRAQAIACGERAEIETVLRRLGADNPGESVA